MKQTSNTEITQATSQVSDAERLLLATAAIKINCVGKM